MVSRRDFIKIGGVSLSAFGFTRTLFARSGVEEELKNMVAGVEPLTEQDFAKRQAKAQEILAQYKIDALFLTGSVNLKYFTNVDWGRSERTFGVLIRRAHEPVWICPAFEAERARERIPKGQEIPYLGGTRESL